MNKEKLPKDWFASFGDRLEGEVVLAKLNKAGILAWSELGWAYYICVHPEDRIKASNIFMDRTRA